jgi:amino acid permease
MTAKPDKIINGRQLKQMKTRTKLGICSTIIWLIIICIVLYYHRYELDKTDIGAWGNFLAGFISPIAFFWLILGYLQQQEELKQNTDALKLQQEELRRQVEGTQELVKQTETQSKATNDLAALEKQRQEEECLRVQPLFKYVSGEINV